MGPRLLLAALLLTCGAHEPPAGGATTSAPTGSAVEDREIPFARIEDLRPGDVSGPIAASIYSFPKELFSVEEVLGLLEFVRRGAPKRELVVLTDLPLAATQTTTGEPLGLTLIDSGGFGFSPWTRDPMTFLRHRDGELLLVLRPNLQQRREADSQMAPRLIEGLPEQTLGPVSWSRAPLPFHNGQILRTPEAIWITIHTLERRALEILGLDRVPVAGFAQPAGIDAYLEAADRAAGELGGLYGRESRFVHALPRAGSAAGRAEAMFLLGGGAGFDLDSVVTLLPDAMGGAAAFVGSLRQGSRLLATVGPAELDRLRETYGFHPAREALRLRLAAGQSSGRAPGLESFLDHTAEHLAALGLRVSRLPLLLVPTALLRTPEAYSDPDFLLGWNNVVTENRDGEQRAEAFEIGLESADRAAVEAFARAGYRLTLLPTLAESVLRNGGYRCASNHIRGE